MSVCLQYIWNENRQNRNGLHCFKPFRMEMNRMKIDCTISNHLEQKWTTLFIILGIGHFWPFPNGAIIQFDSAQCMDAIWPKASDKVEPKTLEYLYNFEILGRKFPHKRLEYGNHVVAHHSEYDSFPINNPMQEYKRAQSLLSVSSKRLQ